MLKNIFGIIVIAATANLNAETLSFPSFQIETPDGWEHSIEKDPGDEWGRLISLRHPDGAGILKMQSYNAPVVVSEGKLRNMTNLASSTPLTWQSWGDYAGYQYNYVEGNTYYRQWWLANERKIIFVTYQCDPASKDYEAEEIDKIIRSITKENSRQGS